MTSILPISIYPEKARQQFPIIQLESGGIRCHSGL